MPIFAIPCLLSSNVIKERSKSVLFLFFTRCYSLRDRLQTQTAGQQQTVRPLHTGQDETLLTHSVREPSPAVFEMFLLQPTLFLLWLLHWNKLLLCTLSVIIAQDMLLQGKSVVIVRFNVRLVSVGNFSVLPQIYWDSSTWFTLYMLFKITAKHLSGLVGIFHTENKHLDRWLLKGI